MDLKSFLESVENSQHIGEERKNMLRENAKWMRDPERAFVASQIVKTDANIAQHEEDTMAELDELEESIKAFERDELPKLRKEEELSEHEEESKQAEQLLNDL